MEAKGQREGEMRKLKRKANVLLAEHKEITEDNPREAILMDALVGCPNIPTGVSDSLSISIVEDPIAFFAHRDHVLENSSKNDMCLFEDDEITPSNVPSGVSHERNGNLFLEDESTLVGKECVEEEGRSAHLINGGALDPSSWMTFPFDPGSELNCEICVGMPGRNGRHMVGDIVVSFPYAGKLFLRFYDPLEGPTLCVGKDSFLDPFSISYSQHDLVDYASYGGRRYLPTEGEV
ncbi:hypothetical protein KY284_000799 [Solanum tuberosum]|nr:hypothetical protein KY284_000799 [Solanum tuberosum]